VDTGEPQLSLFLGEAEARAPVVARVRPRLCVVRGRGHLWTRRRDPSERLWTFHELMERVRLLGFADEALGAGDAAGAVRDDGAALWAAAAVLARRSPFAVRVAPDLHGLYRGLVYGGADVEELASALAPLDGRQQELSELFAQVSEVRRRLAKGGVTDSAEALLRGVRAMERGLVPPALRVFSSVLVEDPVDPTELELRALTALARAGVPLEVRLPIVEGHDGLTEGIHWVAQALEQAFDAPHFELTHAPLVGQGELRWVVDEWYRPSLSPPSDAPARVEVLADPVDEARRVAGVIARWRREPGPPRIAVALRTLDAQAERIADSLAGYGVPVRMSRGLPLLDTPPARVLLDLMRIRRQGAPRDLVLSVLGSPAFEGALTPERTGSLARVLRQAVARTDVEDATRPAGGYRHRLERYANGRESEAEKLRAREAVGEVERVLKWAQRLPLRAPLERFLAASLEVVGEGCVLEDDGAKDRLVEVLQGWSRSLARVAPEGTLEVDLAAVLRLLSRALAEQHLPPPRVVDDTAVEVVSLPELFGRSYDYVVIADCQHGRLPLAERGDPLLGDGDKALVNKVIGRRVLRLSEPDLLEVGPVAARQALEPLWFLGGMAAARQGLLMTAPARDRRGRDVAPSEFLQEALLALGAKPDARSAGPAFAAEPHPRQAQVALAQRVVQGEPARGPEIFAERARLLFEVSQQRRRYFERPAGADPREHVSAYAFFVQPARVAERFGRQLGLMEEKPLGPTRLEALAACRMRGFVEQLLGVDTNPESGHDADARTLGRLAHVSLEVFFRERRDQGVQPARMSVEDRARLRETVDECARPYLEGGEATGHLGALRANVAWLAQSLVRTVSALAKKPPVEGAVPVHFELKIGTRGWEQSEEPLRPVLLQVGERQLWFGGEVDRIDECAGKRVVVDYKNSTEGAIYKKLKPENLFVTHFQLPLYLRLLEAQMPTPDGTELLSYLVSLRDGVASPVVGEGGVLRRRIFDERAATGLSQGLARVLDPIFDGALSTDEGGHCSGCRLARVCRVPVATERGLDDDNAGVVPAPEAAP
jgi:hypothetical protein